MFVPTRRHFITASAGLMVSPLISAQTQPQSWPSKPIRIVVGFAPGGLMDGVARRIGQHFESTFGVPAAVENVTGAGGRIGTQQVARAAGDGHTIMVTSSAAHGVAPALFPQSELGYDPLGQFTHLGLICSGPNALFVRADSPYKSLADLANEGRRTGQPLIYGSGGIGSLGHLAGALIGQQMNVPVQHVAYRGSIPAMQDLLAGHIAAVSDNTSSHMGHYRAGSVRVLAVASAQRIPTLADAPTFSESGYPDVLATAWYGFSGSGGIRPDIALRMNQALAALLQQDDMKKYITEGGMVPEGRMTPDAYTSFVGSEIQKWTALVKSARITVT
jgi:tripartite-type tricarboxylate transporter receptor subunit TctC